MIVAHKQTGRVSQPSVLNVLWIEDRQEQSMLQAILEASGVGPFQLHHVSLLSEARSFKGHTDVILLDLDLPDCRGLQTVKNIVAHFPKSPIIIVSAESNEAAAMESLRHGAQDYLVKTEMGFEWLGRIIRYAIQRRRTQLELEAANQQLQQVNNKLHSVQYQNQQITDIIYEELKTALNTINDCTRQVRNPEASAQHKQWFTKTISDQSLRWVRLIGQIQEMRRLNNGGQTFKRVKLNIVDTVQTAIEQQKRVIDRKDLELEINLSETHFLGCPRFMTQTLHYITSHVVKQSPLGGYLKLNDHEDHHNRCLTIEWEGAYFSQEQLDHGLDYFHLINAWDPEKQPLDLGLPLANQMLIQHGGSLKLVNSDQGPCLTLCLPRAG